MMRGFEGTEFVIDQGLDSRSVVAKGGWRRSARLFLGTLMPALTFGTQTFPSGGTQLDT